MYFSISDFPEIPYFLSKHFFFLIPRFSLMWAKVERESLCWITDHKLMVFIFNISEKEAEERSSLDEKVEK